MSLASRTLERQRRTPCETPSRTAMAIKGDRRTRFQHHQRHESSNSALLLLPLHFSITLHGVPGRTISGMAGNPITVSLRLVYIYIYICILVELIVQDYDMTGVQLGIKQ